MDHTTLAARKASTRASLKQIRAILSGPEREAASAAITRRVLELQEVMDARAIFIFISYGNEVHTHDLLKHFLAQGKVLAVPKILPSKTMVAIPFTRWEELVPGELGILSPAGDRPYAGSFDVVITPGLGFTATGQRIGYGRGYYDRWFASHPGPQKIAIGFECQMVPELPVDESDVLVDMIVTEQRLIKPGTNLQRD